jgi:hypothetical protein
MSRVKERKKPARGPTPPKRKPASLIPTTTTPPGRIPHRIFTHEEIIPSTRHLRLRIMPKANELASTDTEGDPPAITVESE